jgi:hypothetical protein
MALFSGKDQYDFGMISSADDRGIETRDLRREAFGGRLFGSSAMCF